MDVVRGVIEFFDGQFLALLIATVVLFIILFISWWTYRTLSTRNLFHIYGSNPKSPILTWKDKTKYVLKYFFVFPVYTFLGFLIFAFSLFIMSKPGLVDLHAKILFVAIVMVSTIRVCAYVHETMAEDFAKLIPLTMLSLLLMHPSIESFGITTAQIVTFVELIPGFMKYLVFTILLEGALRIGAWMFGSLEEEQP
jgi:hypothetical protein